jgi:hypothetical protein
MSRACMSTRLARLEAHVAERIAFVPAKAPAEEIEEIRRGLTRSLKEGGPEGVRRYVMGFGIDPTAIVNSIPGYIGSRSAVITGGERTEPR